MPLPGAVPCCMGPLLPCFPRESSVDGYEVKLRQPVTCPTLLCDNEAHCCLPLNLYSSDHCSCMHAFMPAAMSTRWSTSLFTEVTSTACESHSMHKPSWSMLAGCRYVEGVTYWDHVNQIDVLLSAGHPETKERWYAARKKVLQDVCKVRVLGFIFYIRFHNSAFASRAVLPYIVLMSHPGKETAVKLVIMIAMLRPRH